MSGAITAALCVLLVVTLPRGGDTAAHLHRTRLVEEGVIVWDASWYSGHYPLAGYSLLYYALAAGVGNVTVAVVSAIASAALFASIARREWGRAGRWPALAFALVAPAPVILGQWPYGAGLAAALAALRALQAMRTWCVLGASALTLAFSPLAFLFLVVVVAAVAVVRPAPRGTRIALTVGLVALSALQVALVVAFPAEHDFHFPSRQLVLALVAVVPAAALALRRSRRDPLGAVLAAWSAAIVLAFVAPVPVGENVTRPRWMLFPLALAAGAQAGFRPRWLAATALVAAFLSNVVPYAAFIRGAPLSREHEATFWEPPLAFLGSDASPAFRVEVVPTASHWEAYYFPRAGHALARGWFRQIDVAENPLLYEDDIDPARYRAWLRARAVRYVVLPRFRLDQRGAEAEARLLVSGRSGLEEVMRARDWTIYELRKATPLLTGPGAPRVTAHRPDRISGAVERPGTYRLRVRHMPYWRVAEGSLCVDPSPDGDTVLRVHRPGRFTVEAVAHPRGLLTVALGRGGASCEARPNRPDATEAAAELGSKVRLAGFEPAASRSGGARSIP